MSKLGQPNEGMDAGDQHRGLYRKYELFRVSVDGERMYLVKDPFFVLRHSTDPHAVVALRAYADSCQAECPQLAADLRAMLDGHE